MDKEFLEKCLQNGMSTRDIEKICDKDHRTISYWIKKYGLSNQSRYAKSDNYKFDVIDTPEKAYVLGFILADAGISENKSVEIAVSIDDKIVVEYISSIIGGNVIYDYTYNKEKRRFPRARLHKKITDIFTFTGGRLKVDRHFPRIKSDLERYLVLGLFDSDGCLTWGRRKDRNRIWQKITFSSQLKILEGLQKYIKNKLNISTAIRPKKNEDCYVLEFSDRSDVLRFCKHIYPDEKFIILQRKYLKYNALRLELEENGEARYSSENTVPSLQSKKV